jgi:hypothetical protein
VPTLPIEVTRVQEAASATEVAHVVVVLAVEISTQEAATVWDRPALHVNDVEDWATLAVREARESVSGVEAENATMLALTREDTEGLVW